jgi:hypothetical protein
MKSTSAGRSAAASAPLVTAAIVATSTSFYLGEWLSHVNLPGVTSADPITALHAVANLRRYNATVAGNIAA